MDRLADDITGMNTDPPAGLPAMKMVVTLKSGVQIRADVESFSTGATPVFGDLRRLKWTTTEEPEVIINWLNVSEVAAVHAEYDHSLATRRGKDA